MKTLYLSDLDGTLLRSDESISEYSIGTINRFIQNGGFFSYVTARSVASALEVTKCINANLPVICANGALIYSDITKEILWSSFFNPGEVAFIKSVLCDLGVYPVVFAYAGGKEYMTYTDRFPTPQMERFFGTISGDAQARKAVDLDELYSGNVFHFVCMDDDASYFPIISALEKDNRFYYFSQEEITSGDFWFNILPVNATKANGALQLKAMLGIDRIVVFGDQRNDLPLFSVADECYAMENALPELIEAATAVIDSNNNDGVAKWIEKNAL